jgi:hypothetical protein
LPNPQNEAGNSEAAEMHKVGFLCENQSSCRSNECKEIAPSSVLPEAQQSVEEQNGK